MSVWRSACVDGTVERRRPCACRSIPGARILTETSGSNPCLEFSLSQPCQREARWIAGPEPGIPPAALGVWVHYMHKIIAFPGTIFRRFLGLLPTLPRGPCADARESPAAQDPPGSAVAPLRRGFQGISACAPWQARLGRRLPLARARFPRPGPVISWNAISPVRRAFTDTSARPGRRRKRFFRGVPGGQIP